MTARVIPGYVYGTTMVTTSPLTMEDLEKLKQVVLFGPEDERYLRMAGQVLADQIEQVFDVWYDLIAAHPFLLYYFTDGQGHVNDTYLKAVRKRFEQWILDTCDRPYDQAWLDYQQEIALRHESAKKKCYR